MSRVGTTEQPTTVAPGSPSGRPRESGSPTRSTAASRRCCCGVAGSRTTVWRAWSSAASGSAAGCICAGRMAAHSDIANGAQGVSPMQTHQASRGGQIRDTRLVLSRAVASRAATPGVRR